MTTPASPDRRIADYAMIGNGRTVALIDRAGTVAWYCPRRIDAPAVFAAMLGTPDNGQWQIAPDTAFTVTRRYRPGTLILETRFRTDEGTVLLTDLMDVRDGPPTLIRIVTGEEGTVRMRADLALRFDYGRSVPWVTSADDGTLDAVCGPDRMALRSDVPHVGRDNRTVAAFDVAAGESYTFALAHGPSHEPRPPLPDVAEAAQSAQAYWRDFSDKCADCGEWSEDVRASLLVLKALAYRPTGAIVAAATTSLPEALGGGRNWDYRFCWLRDATITLQAFLEMGYTAEAQAWRDWLLRSVAGDPAQVQILYGVGGERDTPERELPWLAGFAGSQPVRIGNAAAGQLQIDIFGEVADMLAQAHRGGMATHPQTCALAGQALDRLDTLWREPDAGIWEIRGDQSHHVHSKVMAWVAFDRAAKMVRPGAERDRWRGIADTIHAEVCARGYDDEIGSFVQSYGSKALDSSLLFIVLTGFLSPNDPRATGTVRAIEDLLMRDGLLMRYDTSDTDDGLAGSEGVFLACSFWLADTWILQGRKDEARALFERLLALRNDVGLLPEEFDTATGQALGNVPQAFSHAGLVSTAMNLTRPSGPAHHRHDLGRASLAEDDR